MHQQYTKRMTERERYLLSVIAQAKRTELEHLQALIYVHQHQTKRSHYTFTPWIRGPHSLQMMADVFGMGDLDGATLRIGGRMASGKPIQLMDIQLPPEQGADLIRLAHRLDPYYAIESELVEDLFGADLTWLELEKARYCYGDRKMLLTIGQQGKTIEEVVNILIKHDVALLLDLREHPDVEQFGFSYEELRTIIGKQVQEYEHPLELDLEGYRASDLEDPIFLIIRHIIHNLEERRRVALLVDQPAPVNEARDLLNDQFMLLQGLEVLDF